MTPYALKTGDISPKHYDFLLVVRKLLEEMKDFLSCHEVCNSIAEQFPDIVVHYRGTFNINDHSWLVFLDNNKVILDPYPWCSASGPLLITTDYYLNPWNELYRGEPVI